MRAFAVAVGWVVCGVGLVLGQDTSSWHEPFPPHRIADNLYYVGSRGLASYLITSSEGHILVNSSFERTVPMIRASIEKLGFKITDVKILLSSHAHSDHVAGLGLMKELTGGKVFVMAGDDGVISKGGEGQYLYDERWRPCAVDRVLHDGEKVSLGNVVLTARLTPGHTRGCTTWTMTAMDGEGKREVVIIGSPNVNAGYQLVNNRDYPEIAEDFKRTFKTLKSLRCEIFLGAHGNYYDMERKFEKMKGGGGANPFVDAKGYEDFIDDREKAFLAVLKKQQ
jgi:metallo-beta-lactamase class B